MQSVSVIDLKFGYNQIPMDVTASTVVSGFLRTWVSRYRVPVTVVTNRGSQFTCEVWSTMCKKLHISHRTTTAYHPKANG